MSRNALVCPGILCACVPLLFLSVPGASAVDPDRVKTVLILYAFEKDLPANIIMDESIRSTFKADSTERIEVFSEHMDLRRFADAGYERQLVEHYRQKYSRQKIDLVMPVIAPALDFVLKYR